MARLTIDDLMDGVVGVKSDLHEVRNDYIFRVSRSTTPVPGAFSVEGRLNRVGLLLEVIHAELHDLAPEVRGDR